MWFPLMRELVWGINLLFEPKEPGRTPYDRHPTPRELRKLSRKGPKDLKLGPGHKTRHQVQRHQ